MTNNTSIPRDKIKTMQKDIKNAKIKKIEIKPVAKMPEQIQPIKQTIPTISEQKKDFTTPVTPKMSDIKPIQKTETIQMKEPIQSQPERPTPPEIRPIVTGRTEQKPEEINNIKTKDEYREPIE